MRIIINTLSTKKKTGGAFQIAYNFLLESLSDTSSGVEWFYFVSSDLDEAVGSRFNDKRDKTYFAFPTQPDFRGSYKMVKKQIAELEDRIHPDLVYSITAPSYFRFKAIEVMRFTNPWVAHPNRYAWRSLPLKSRVKTWLYCFNQKRMIKGIKYFVTQAEATKQGLLRITGLPSGNIKVVPNVLPSVFSTMDNTSVPKADNWIDIACVGTAMSHKNIIIVPEVIKCLESKYGLKNVRVHLTIDPEKSVSKRILKRVEQCGVSDRIINHGHVSQTQLAEIYRHCDICFLPTLLEVFSATSLEAMYFKLYIVATDFFFNRLVIGNAGLYCEPNNAADSADKIYSIISSNESKQDLETKMDLQLNKFSDHSGHFKSIVSFLTEIIKTK